MDIQEYSSIWKGTSYQKLTDCMVEMQDLANLSNSEIESYIIPIVLDQDYDNLYVEDRLFSKQREYRYHDYADVKPEHRNYTRPTRTWWWTKLW